MSAGKSSNSAQHPEDERNASSTTTSTVHPGATTTAQHQQDLLLQSQLDAKDRQLRAAQGVNDFLRNQVARFFAQHEEAKLLLRGMGSGSHRNEFFGRAHAFVDGGRLYSPARVEASMMNKHES